MFRIRIWLSLAMFAFWLAVVPVLAETQVSGVTWQDKVAVASGNGVQGPWRMNKSEYDYVDDPTVAINEQGFIGVSWVDQARKDVFFQLYQPDGTTRLDTPVNVSRSPTILSWLPRALIGPSDVRNVHILWQEIVFSGGSHGGEILFARSIDGGATFAAPINLSNSLGGDGKGRLTARSWHNGSLDLAIDPEGNFYAVWTEYEGTLWLAESIDSGASFSPPKRLVDGDVSGPARGPSIAIDVRGTIYIAWTVGENRAANIQIARSDDQGHSFSPPQAAFSTNGHADAPKIAVDRQGTIHLVYAESPDGPFERYHIVYSRSGDGGRSFDVPREISAPRIGKTKSAHHPALRLDGDDNLFVIWELVADRRTRSSGLGFAVSNDRGSTFTPPALVPGSMDPALGVNGSLQGLLMNKLAVNQSGALAVVNSTFKRDEHSGIWLFRAQAGNDEAN